MLPAATRDNGVLRAQIEQRDAGGIPRPPSRRRRQRRGPVHGGRLGHNQENDMSSRHTQAATMRAPERSRRNAQRARLGRPPSRPCGVSPRAVGPSSDMAAREYNAAKLEVSTSDTETSDEEEKYSTHSAVQEEPAPTSEEPSSSGIGGVVVGCATSDRLAHDRRTPAKSASPSKGYIDEIAALLDPNQPPSVVLMFRGWADELGTLPSVEDYLRVDPGIRPIGDSSDDSSDT
ncbi:hypothetical protein HPB48_011859 [Haemaphysalis longicornis]|uniref:Uncharacterized protein n=1 Tax=Haemaphysalis longicornis TaxID=44386 RepID=A0A9J6FJG6_HAELO|nr:hypothetical protein HPB48_011859 [Haemaphysalis longicornis]